MKIVGLNAYQETIEIMIKCRDAYCSGVPLPVIAMDLQRGNGRTLCAQMLYDVLQENGILNTMAISRVIEVKADGSSACLEAIQETLVEETDYTNSYDGVIALDITDLCAHAGECIARKYVELIAQLRKSAVVLLYTDQLDSAAQRLIRDIRMETGEVQCIHVQPYERMEIAMILIRCLREYHAVLPSEEMLVQMCADLVESEGARTARDALRIAQKLMLEAEYIQGKAHIHLLSKNQDKLLCNSKE